jgi:hypothetical protein
MEKYEDVDFKPFFNWINNEIFQISPPIQFEINLNRKKPAIICPNLADKCGIMGKVFSDVGVDFFNFDSTENGFWGTLNIFYKTSFNGGNGTLIGEFQWDKIAGWKVFSPKKGKWICL